MIQAILNLFKQQIIFLLILYFVQKKYFKTSRTTISIKPYLCQYGFMALCRFQLNL